MDGTAHMQRLGQLIAAGRPVSLALALTQLPTLLGESAPGPTVPWLEELAARCAVCLASLLQTGQGGLTVTLPDQLTLTLSVRQTPAGLLLMLTPTPTPDPTAAALRTRWLRYVPTQLWITPYAPAAEVARCTC